MVPVGHSLLLNLTREESCRMSRRAQVQPCLHLLLGMMTVLAATAADL